MATDPLPAAYPGTGTGAEPGRGDRFARLIIVPLLAIFATLIIVFYILYGATIVVGESMLPTLRPDDRVLHTRGYDRPVRGDVIIVNVVGQRGTSEDIVKRIIAVPGDTVEIRSDVAWVNGLPEPPRGEVVVPAASVSRPPIQVPRGYIYVLGDNRPISYDSRYIGPVPLEKVRGRAEWVFAPITRLGRVR